MWSASGDLKMCATQSLCHDPAQKLWQKTGSRWLKAKKCIYLNKTIWQRTKHKLRRHWGVFISGISSEGMGCMSEACVCCRDDAWRRRTKQDYAWKSGEGEREPQPGGRVFIGRTLGHGASNYESLHPPVTCSITSNNNRLNKAVKSQPATAIQ